MFLMIRPKRIVTDEPLLVLASLNTKKSFFCSELVAAAQITTGIIRENYNVSFFWPGSFAEGGAVDEAMVDGLRYGTEILIDCRDIEVGRARFY